MTGNPLNQSTKTADLNVTVIFIYICYTPAIFLQVRLKIGGLYTYVS
jgi:hypothetical protein